MYVSMYIYIYILNSYSIFLITELLIFRDFGRIKWLILHTKATVKSFLTKNFYTQLQETGD